MMWTDNKEDKCKKQMNELLPVILTGNYPAVILNKMNYIHLEGIVTQLVLYTRRGDDRYYVSSKLTRPRWWPKDLKFEDPITKLRPDLDHHDLPFKWSRTLREVVKSCSRFHFGVNQRLRRYFRQCKCKENSYATIQRRQRSKLVRNHTFKTNVYSNKIPVVKLYDVIRQCEEERSTTTTKKKKSKKKKTLSPEPEVVATPTRVHHKEEKENAASAVLTDRKILSRAYVRLHDICDTPKQIETECSKDGYMEYFRLGQANRVASLSTAKHRPNQSKVFRNFNIPISSELGQMLVPTITDKSNTLWRLQRLEWFLKEAPQVKCEQEYPVVYAQRQGDSAPWMHEYKFPKRQFFQTQCSSRRYYKLGVCKPVCVRLERLDLRDDRYTKYLGKQQQQQRVV